MDSKKPVAAGPNHSHQQHIRVMEEKGGSSGQATTSSPAASPTQGIVREDPGQIAPELESGGILAPAPSSDKLSIKDDEDAPAPIALEKIVAQEDDTLYFPDGGYGWVVIGCMFFSNMVTWGINSSFGVFLSFYLQNDYFPGATPLQFAFVGGLSLSLAMAVGPVSNYLSKAVGFRYTMCAGAAMLAGGQILAGFSKHIWHLFLTQGVLFGLGLGFIMVSITPVATQWFDKKRGLALGIGGGGSGAGGLLFSNITRIMLEKTSLKWAFLLNGLISTAVLMPCIFLLKTRNKPLKTRFEPFKISLFKMPAFLSLVAWGVFTQLSYTVGIYSVPTYATEGLGLPQKDGATLQAIMAAGQLTLRPLCGLFLDKVGRINGAMLVTIAAGLTNLLIWMFARNFSVLALFAYLQGGLGGVFWISNNALLTEIIGIRNLASGLSMLWLSIVAPATIAEAVALLLVDHSKKDLGKTGPAAYHISIGFAGACFVVSGLSLLVAKFWKQGNLKVFKKT